LENSSCYVALEG